MFRPVLVLIALLPALAGAALPPCAVDANIRAATDVVQVEVLQVERPPGIGDPDRQVVCPVRAVVRRVFRGGLSPDQVLEFGVLCWSRIPGADVSVDADALAAARFLELHMAGGQPIRRGPGTLILERLTDGIVWEPSCK